MGLCVGKRHKDLARWSRLGSCLWAGHFMCREDQAVPQAPQCQERSQATTASPHQALNPSDCTIYDQHNVEQDQEWLFTNSHVPAVYLQRGR